MSSWLSICSTDIVFDKIIIDIFLWKSLKTIVSGSLLNPFYNNRFFYISLWSTLPTKSFFFLYFYFYWHFIFLFDSSIFLSIYMYIYIHVKCIYKTKHFYINYYSFVSVVCTLICLCTYSFEVSCIFHCFHFIPYFND